jgi:deoxyribodipyrimidine photo-lyase
MKTILWFRKDLRLYDHPGITMLEKEKLDFIAVFCIGGQFKEQHHLGFPVVAQYRKHFLMESLVELNHNLQYFFNHSLHFLCGEPAEKLKSFAMEIKANRILTASAFVFSERNWLEKVRIFLAEHEINLETFQDATLLHPEDLPFSVENTPGVFTGFRASVENKVLVRKITGEAYPPIASDNSAGLKQDLAEALQLKSVDVDKRSSFLYYGGTSRAFERLQKYFWEDNLLKDYKLTRNGLLGPDFSSRLSAWLSLGCISTKEIYRQVKLYEKERVANDSTYWLIFELLWRDFFKFTALKHGEEFTRVTGVKGAKKGLLRDVDKFRIWTEGRTGQPIIDASITELSKTGYTSNRGRQILASYLVNDLKIDWTWGASFFESLLVDFDPESNWGNWSYIAGVGNDPRQNRYFNPLKQTERYDPQKNYINTWLKFQKREE